MKSFLAIYLLCGAGAVALEGCGCLDGDDNARDACREVTAAVNHVRVSCGLSESDELSVCGAVCSGPAGCSEHTDVRACVYAIEELSCDRVTITLRTLPECYDVFASMDASCSEGSDSDDGADWDDDDF